MFMYISAFVVAVAISFLNLYGSTNGLYVTMPYYNVFMHLLGGIGIGLLLSAIIYSIRPDLPRKYIYILIGVLIIGVAWELFEAYFDLASYVIGSKPYYMDTARDLMNDLIGGGIILTVIFLIKRKLSDRYGKS